MHVLETTRTKRAVRAFTSQPAPEADIIAIPNAGRRAQSSRNDQPRPFIVVGERETLAQLATCGGYAGHLAGAAFAVAVVSSTRIPGGSGSGCAQGRRAAALR